MIRIPALLGALLAVVPILALDRSLPAGTVLDDRSKSFSSAPSELGKWVGSTTVRNSDAVQIQGSSSTGDPSSSCAELLDGAGCKVPAARDATSVRDFGAMGDGSDQTAAIKAAQAAAKSSVLHFPVGIYRTDGSVPYGPTIDTAYEMIAPQISGYLPNIQDGRAANTSVRLWTVPWGGRFAHGLALQGVNYPSIGTNSYERTGMVFRYEQRDPSTYGTGGSARDLVGTDWQGIIYAGNMTGRIWGTSTTLTIPSGADGYAIMHEGGIINNGTAQPFMSTPTSKVGVQMVADGTANLTAGYTAIASGSGAKWAHAFYVDATAVDRNAFVLRQGASGPDLASISASGALHTVSDARIGGKVGFNGAAPTGKCRLPAILPSDGSATNAALAAAFNAVRACLVSVGLAR